MIRLDQVFSQLSVADQARPALRKLEKATEGMEKVFLKDLLGQMRKTMGIGSGDSYSTTMVRDMLDDALADTMSQRGDFGIAKQLYDNTAPQLIRAEMARIKANLRQIEQKLPDLKIDIQR